MTLPEGFSINPNAADGKVACQRRRSANFGTASPPNARSSRRSGRLEHRQLGAARADSRRSSTSASRCRATGTGSSSSPTASPPTSSSPAPSTPIRRPASSRIAFNDLPQSPLTAFNMHFFGSERGLLATPTQCGTYAVNTTFVPWNSSARDADVEPVLHPRLRPERRAVPGRHTRPFCPELRRGLAGNTAGAIRPFAVELPRPTATRTSPGSSVTTPPGFSALAEGYPLLPGVGDRAARPARSTRRLAELAAPACPPQPDRHRSTAGAGAGSRPLYVPGKVYLAGPYKRRAAEPRRRRPGRLGSLRPRQRRGPRGDLRRPVDRPGDDGLRSAAADHRGDSAAGVDPSGSTLDRPNFALNPTNCEPFSVSATVTGDEGATSSCGHLFQVAELRRAFPTRRSSPSSSRVASTGAATRRSTPSSRAKRRRSQHPRVSVTLPKGELLDNAHIDTICTQGRLRARHLSGRLDDRRGRR